MNFVLRMSICHCVHDISKSRRFKVWNDAEMKQNMEVASFPAHTQYPCEKKLNRVTMNLEQHHALCPCKVLVI